MSTQYHLLEQDREKLNRTYSLIEVSKIVQIDWEIFRDILLTEKILTSYSHIYPWGEQSVYKIHRESGYFIYVKKVISNKLGYEPRATEEGKRFVSDLIERKYKERKVQSNQWWLNGNNADYLLRQKFNDKIPLTDSEILFLCAYQAVAICFYFKYIIMRNENPIDERPDKKYEYFYSIIDGLEPIEQYARICSLMYHYYQYNEHLNHETIAPVIMKNIIKNHGTNLSYEKYDFRKMLNKIFENTPDLKNLSKRKIHEKLTKIFEFDNSILT